ncbi:hypothetical protein ACVI1L_003697 [Bradyrhizobium sp. USDA 4516]
MIAAVRQQPDEMGDAIQREKACHLRHPIDCIGTDQASDLGVDHLAQQRPHLLQLRRRQRTQEL